MIYIVAFLVVVFNVTLIWGIGHSERAGRYVPDLDAHARHDAAVMALLTAKYRGWGESNPFIDRKSKTSPA